MDALLPSPTPTFVQQEPELQRTDNQLSDDMWDPDVPQASTSVQPSSRRVEDNNTKPPHGFPILEFISPPITHTPSGSGKTSLIYLITALSILPPSISSVSLDGQNAAVVVLDPLSHFNVSRLAEVCISLILSKITDLVHRKSMKTQIKEVVKNALIHVHIFCPTSWEEMIDSLKGMPEYLFDGTRHQSMQRRVRNIVVEDVDAFYWDIRSAPSTHSTSPLTTASARLTHALLSLSSQLSAAIVLSSHSGASSPKLFRAPIPLSTSWPSHVQVTRLAVRRVEVLRFAPEISVEEAERERGQRWGVVKRGRFECRKVSGVGDVKNKENDGGGFVFRVREGVEVEKEERR